MQLTRTAAAPALPRFLRRIPWLTLLLALVAGAVIHIVATLIIPKLATGTAWYRIAASLPANRMLVLPQATPTSQILPFVGPDVRMAVCRFDVGNGPVSITATLPDRGWTLGLYTPAGDNFYAIPAQDFRRTEVRFTLTPPEEKFLGVFDWGRRPVDTTGSTIAVPATQGLVMLRAPMRGRAYTSEIEAVLARAQCAPQRL